jgi:DNA-binding response OmpR family regulator
MNEGGVKRRVLFVEDESGLRQAYRRYFAGRFDASFAATGAEARVLVRDVAPELVVLDLRLPDADGMDLLRELRALRPELRVVVTTSYASMQPLFEMLGIAHNGYLVKPFALSDLAAQIDAAF